MFIALLLKCVMLTMYKKHASEQNLAAAHHLGATLAPLTVHALAPIASLPNCLLWQRMNLPDINSPDMPGMNKVQSLSVHEGLL